MRILPVVAAVTAAFLVVACSSPIIITNMLLYPGDLEREVTLWNCIQTRLTRRTSPGKG